MNLIPVNLATEDELSEITLLAILRDLKRFTVGIAYRRGGSGFLRKTADGWNRAAAGIPFILLTDLDTLECPAALIRQWLASPRSPNLLFRVAVREIESWLLADRKGIADFLGVNASLISAAPDSLADPKRELIDLARRSRKEIRGSIVPRPGSTAKQGPDYNGCLGHFVTTRWEVRSACANSPSLARTVQRLAEFSPIWLLRT